MARHIFNFDGGGYLTTMGAAWFVSYSFYSVIDKNHNSWMNVKTYPSRISTFNNTNNYHRFWLEQILCMEDENLNKNTLEIDAGQIKEMAKKLLGKSK